MEDSLYGSNRPIFSVAGAGVGATVAATVDVGATVGADDVGTLVGAAGAGEHASTRATATVEPAAAALASKNRRRDRLTCWRSRRTWDPTSWTGRSCSDQDPY